MTIERFIFIAIAVISISSFLYIPKEKVRVALLSFVTFQATSWFVSNMLVQFDMISYPVREFTKATNVNFIPQFILYPALFTWFILLFPEKRSILMKAIHYIIFVSLMVWFIYFTSQYTNIHEFPNSTNNFNFAQGYLRNLSQFAICHIYIIWFFKNEKST
jgi:hypothetical protein